MILDSLLHTPTHQERRGCLAAIANTATAVQTDQGAGFFFHWVFAGKVGAVGSCQKGLGKEAVCLSAEERLWRGTSLPYTCKTQPPRGTGDAGLSLSSCSVCFLLQEAMRSAVSAPKIPTSFAHPSEFVDGLHLLTTSDKSMKPMRVQVSKKLSLSPAHMVNLQSFKWLCKCLAVLQSPQVPQAA